MKLFSPVSIGKLTLANRVVMAPLTRCRAAEPDCVVTDMHAKYYVQRATAGLMISEATCISKSAQGYAGSPGIYTDAQQAGWTQVLKAVHDKGGVMSCQLWHVGRISHHIFQPDGGAPVAPSAIAAPGAHCNIVQGDVPPAWVSCDPPRALTVPEIKQIVRDYQNAAKRALAAGFDFVEEHAANGYLLQQFQCSSSNIRTDEYGGSLENRARLTLEVMDALLEVVPPEKLGVRISPYFNINGILESDPEEMALYLVKAFEARGIAYLSIAEPSWVGGIALTDDFKKRIRESFSNTIIYAGEYTAEKAEKAVTSGLADAIGFGRPYIANPDLVARMAQGGPYNQLEKATIYFGQEKGYLDYPFLEK